MSGKGEKQGEYSFPANYFDSSWGMMTHFLKCRLSYSFICTKFHIFMAK